MTPYYQDDAVTLYCGDCRDILPTLGQVDHVITDPPYSEHVHGKQRRGGSAHRGAVVCDGRELGFDALPTALREECARQFARITTRWVLVFSDVESTFEWRSELTRSRRASLTMAETLAATCDPLEYVRTGVWVKPGATPQFTGDRPAPGYEAITICHRRGKKRWNGGGSHAVWTCPIVAGGSHNPEREHTTQKPEPLMAELVALFTDPGDTILDPFAGSGTTLVAAKRLGRKAIGIELQEDYCKVAARRLAQGALPLEWTA